MMSADANPPPEPEPPLGLGRPLAEIARGLAEDRLLLFNFAVALIVAAVATQTQGAASLVLWLLFAVACLATVARTVLDLRGKPRRTTHRMTISGAVVARRVQHQENVNPGSTDMKIKGGLFRRAEVRDSQHIKNSRSDDATA
jgi:hypothetical protein